MNLLLDTHAFLWFMSDDASLFVTARAAIVNACNQVWRSAASAWEITSTFGRA